MMLRICALAVLVLTGAGKAVTETDGVTLTDAAVTPAASPEGLLPGTGQVPFAPGWPLYAG